MCNPKKDFVIIKNNDKETFSVNNSKSTGIFDVISKVFTDAIDNCKEIRMKKDKTIIYM